jgi:hypothetical protein
MEACAIAGVCRSECFPLLDFLGWGICHAATDTRGPRGGQCVLLYLGILVHVLQLPATNDL